MLNVLMPIILQIALKLIPIFIRKEEDRQKYALRVQEQFKRYQQGVGDAARVREEHQSLDKKLDEEWKKKWGTPVPVVTPITVEPTVPTEVTVKEVFLFEADGIPEGKVVRLWAEKTYELGYMAWNGTRGTYQLNLALNTAGVRVLNVQVDGQWVSQRTVTVRAV